VLRASAALRRIGDLAIHIAELVLRRHPEPSVPAGFTPVVTALAEAVSRVTHAAAAAIRQGNEPGPEIRRLDDDVDALHRDLLHLLTVNDSRLRPDATVDLTLLGRYLERIGDQAVNATAWRRDPVGAA
jgi:phosphate transport system protein